jgi:poly-gamma-glutamate capsule biosynthesis protein CapA/YwtB (metallophosphatase superfamily)
VRQVVVMMLLSSLACLSHVMAGSSASRTGRDSVILRFAGDVLLGYRYEASVSDSIPLGQAAFTLLRDADVAMVNLENPITLRGAKTPKPFNFRMHPRYLSTLLKGGVDIVTIANNHVFDYSYEGLFDTFSYLDSVGIRRVGAGRSLEDAERPVVLAIRGFRFAFLAAYGGGEAPVASKSRPGVAPRDPVRLGAQIRRLRQHDSVDVVVVNLHWGTEKATRPDNSQRSLAQQLIDAGADAVIGHHPHVLQGIERYKSGVIAYSLGNFMFGGNARSTYDTGVFEISCSKDGVTYRFIPVGIREWRAVVLTGADREKVMQSMKNLSSIFPKTIF